MIRRTVLAMTCAIFVGGCAVPPRVTAVYPTSARPHPPNLALSDRAYETYVATQIPPRTDWPAVPTGIRLNDVTYYSRTDYEFQTGFDEHGGVYYGGETTTTGIWLR